MLVFDFILSFIGLGVMLWLLFTLAVYALPFFAVITAGMAALHSGAGVIGAILVAAIVGGVTLAIGEIVSATVRSLPIRAMVALLYAIPAAIAGYSATHGLAELSMPSATWQMIFAVIGANLRRVHRLRSARHDGPAGCRPGFFGVCGRAEAFAGHQGALSTPSSTKDC